MKEKNDELNLSPNRTDNQEEINLPGYPIYPDSDDIYKKFLEVEEINPEDTSKMKDRNSTNKLRRKELEDGQSEQDLDIPGSELDDLQDDIGNEDEENNYYSIGGDEHLNLEEDHGENNI